MAPSAASASLASPSTPASMLSTPSSAPLASAASSSTSSAAHAAVSSSVPYSAPAYGPSAIAGWPSRGWRAGWASEAAPSSLSGSKSIGGPRPPSLRTFGYTDWVMGADGRPRLVPGAAAAAMAADEAAWKAAESAGKELEEETEEEVEAVGPTPEDIVEEFKRAGHFDSLRKELLSSFTSSPLLPSLHSFVERHLLTLLDSSQERRKRLAGLDKRLQNMEMCKEIEDNTDLMRRVVASVRGDGEGLVVEVGRQEVKAEGDGPKEVKMEQGEGEEMKQPKAEPGLEAVDATSEDRKPGAAATSTTEASTTPVVPTALLGTDSPIGVSLRRKVQELVKAERERREEENEGEDNSEAEGKNTPGGGVDESVRNGSATPVTPAYASASSAKSFLHGGGGQTPINASLPPPSATPKTASFAETPTFIEPPASASSSAPAANAVVMADDEEQDMDMD